MRGAKAIGGAVVILTAAQGCAGPQPPASGAPSLEPAPFVLPEPAQAGAPIRPLEPKGSEWSVIVAPYFWAPAMSGEIETGRLPSTDFSKGFSDIVEDLELGLMFAVEAREPGSPWSLLIDTVYMKLEDELGRGEVELTQSVLETDFAYRPIRDHELDLLIGGRLWNLDTEVEIDGIGSVTTDRTWFDPIIGARETVPFAGNFSLQARADIGGFGLGCDLTWQLLGTVRWQLSPSFTVAGGYRWMYIDYDHGSLDLQTDYYGPIAGLLFAF
jgi:hypothetical protein